MTIATPVPAPGGLLRLALACAAAACLGACGGGGADTASTSVKREGDRAAASAATVYQVVTDGRFAVASYFGSNGCVSLGLDVFAQQGQIRSDPSNALSESYVHAQLVSVDWCVPGGAESFMSGRIDTQEMKFRHDLSHVVASASIRMKDSAGNGKTVLLDLVWSGGELTTDASKSMIVTPLTRSFVKTDGAFRASESVSGTLKLDGVELLATDPPVANGYVQGMVASSGGLTIDINRSR